MRILNVFSYSQGALGPSQGVRGATSGNKEVGRRITWEVGKGKWEEGLHGKWAEGSMKKDYMGSRSRGVARRITWEVGTGKLEQQSGKTNHMGGGNKEVGRRITWEVGPGKWEEGLHGKWEQGSGLNENPQCVFVLTRGPGTKSKGVRGATRETPRRHQGGT